MSPPPAELDPLNLALSLPHTPWSQEALARVRAVLEPARDPVRAQAMRAYLRDQFPFLGIGKPQREALLRGVLAPLGRPAQADVRAFAVHAFAQDEREYAYVGLGVLRKYVRSLDAGALEVVRALILFRSWWDTVDELAQNVLGPLVAGSPQLVAELDRWSESGALWLVRSAIIYQNGYKQRTDAARLFSICARHARDDAFFIRKGIGWALRSHAAIDPDAVRSFVAAHPELSGLSRREALRGVTRAEARQPARTARS